MRTQPHDTARAHTATTDEPTRRAPCPSCGGMGYHPSVDTSRRCYSCRGTGAVQSATIAHEHITTHTAMAACLLRHAVTSDLDADTADALRYAAQHLTVQAAVMVDLTPGAPPTDASPADKVLSHSMTRAGGDLVALDAVLVYTGDSDMDAALLSGAAIIARTIADRMQHAADEIAELRTDAVGASEAGAE